MTTDRALLDIAASSSPAHLRRLFIEAGRHRLLENEVLARCLARGRCFKGFPELRKLVEAWTSGTGFVRSPFEGEFRLFCVDRHLLTPESNVIVGGYEVDCLWPELKLIVELDGRQFHDDGFAFEADRTKANELTALGYRVLRVTWRMLSQAPDDLERTLRRMGCK